MTIRAASAGQARRWLRECVSVGDAPSLVGRPTIDCRAGTLRIGHRFRLASQPVPSHLVAGPGGTLEIGNDVSIGHGAAVTAIEQVRIGDGTHIGPFVIIMDTNFHGSPGNQSLQHDTRPVTIGEGCRIGSRVTISRGVSIGDGAEILAGSVVSSAVPPGACAAGGRARIIGRAGSLDSRWDSAAAALPEILMASLGLDSPPDLDGSPLPAQVWTAASQARLLDALKERLDVSLPADSASRMATFAELAAAVQCASRKPFSV